MVENHRMRDAARPRRDGQSTKTRGGLWIVAVLAVVCVAGAFAIPRPQRWLRSRHARELAASGEPVAALREYDALVAASPTDSALRVERGHLNADCSRWSEAIADFSFALQDPALFYDAMVSRAWVKFKAGEDYGAKDDARSALLHDDARPQAWIVFGLIALRAEDFEAAYRHFDDAHRLDPRNPNTCADRALALEKLGRLKEARSALEADLRDGVDSVKMRENLARVLMDLNELSDARINAEAALRMEDSNTQCLLILGKIEVLSGRLAESQAAFQRLTQIDPTNYWAYLGLGIVAEKRGDNSSAYDQFTRAAEIEPSWRAARRRRGLLDLGPHAVGTQILELEFVLSENGSDSEVEARLRALRKAAAAAGDGER